MENFQPPHLPESEEMEPYGFDSSNADDVAAFHMTDPEDPEKPVTDYSDDAFEFGSNTGQHEIIVVESDTQTNSDD